MAFETRGELERNRALIGEEWDEEELYFVVEEMMESFPQMRYERFSFCSGLFTLEKTTAFEKTDDTE